MSLAPPRNPLPIVPTEALVRRAEIEAAEAQHALSTADPRGARIDLLRTAATEARGRAHRLRRARLDDDSRAVRSARP